MFPEIPREASGKYKGEGAINMSDECLSPRGGKYGFMSSVTNPVLSGVQRKEFRVQNLLLSSGEKQL